MTKDTQAYSEQHITMNDGVKIYVRDYQPKQEKGPVCIILSGLTRNVRDGHNLAMNLMSHKTTPCRVISLDYRGRGQSDYCHYDQYTVPREALDVADVMVALNIHKGVIIGTSRGGMIAMTLGAMRPGLLAGVVLNDIGPVLELDGLNRILSYVGVKVEFNSWEQVVAALKLTNPGFKLSEEDWLAFAHRLMRDENGVPKMDYDETLGESFKAIKPEDGAPLPTMWPQFDTLKHLPLLIIRGSGSDLFSDKVMVEMAKTHGNADTLTVKDRGHAPFLDEDGVLEKIIKLCKKSL